jgi:RAQPRD family integrative conjugative element protein
MCNISQSEFNKGEIMKLCKALLIVAALFSGGVSAATELEEINLQRVADELRLVQRIALEAQSHSSNSDRTEFDYKKLVWNLSEMTGAIERHINKPSTAPRHLEELYTEFDGE